MGGFHSSQPAGLGPAPDCTLQSPDRRPQTTAPVAFGCYEEETMPTPKETPLQRFRVLDEAELERLRATSGAKPADCFLTKELAGAAGKVLLGKRALWILDGADRLIEAVEFPEGVPSWNPGFSAWGNSSRAAISESGSIVFYRDRALLLWDRRSRTLRAVARTSFEPETLAISPAEARVAIAGQVSLKGWFGWAAEAWALADGTPLGRDLRWSSPYSGSLDSFGFSADGSGMHISITVSAQAGDDFGDYGAYDLEVGPEPGATVTPG